MIFYYTARETFDKDDAAWQNYIELSRLSQLTELVSLDASLNEDLVEPDLDNENDTKYIMLLDDSTVTCFFTSMEYVLNNMKPRERFNLLAVVIEPAENCADVRLEGFDFLGYELLDQYYWTSPLSNCGGFDETFLPLELNQFGLLGDYEKAFDIQRRLFENNPGEVHADTNVIAVWRHTVIGRDIIA